MDTGTISVCTPKWKNPSRTPTYLSWKSAVSRCHNPKHVRFYDYGGRGIKVCDRWRHDYDAFFEDMGERPDGMTLDRKDTDGDYTKDNCRWATPARQNRNMKSNVIITLIGIPMTITDWRSILGVSKSTYYDRVKSGMTPEQALLVRRL